MLDSVIRAMRLTRQFGNRVVVNDLTLNIPRGQISALLGLNGAGKTTTIRIIMGLLHPTRGRCQVFDEDSRCLSTATRRRIGYLVEGHFLYSSMRIRETAQFQREGTEHWDENLFNQIISHFAISPLARVGELSRGQRAGVALALVLAPNPEVLILDDPALGLDPVSRRALNETLIEFSGGGQRTVLLSSHLLDDVERVADNVLLIVKGRLKVDVPLDEFKHRLKSFWVHADQVDPAGLSTIAGLVEARRIGQRLKLVVADADENTTAVIERLDDKVEIEELPFSDAVLAYLARERPERSFLSGRG